MNKDQLKAAFAKGARIQAWHLLPGATNSNQGQWDTLTPKEGAKPEFGCEAHLYRVHPEDLTLIAELGQEVGAVDYEAAQREFTEYFVKNYPGPYTVIMDPTWHAPKIFRAAKRALRPSPAQTSEARDAARSEAYDKVDRFLRNTLMDAAYSEYSDALEIACGYAAPPKDSADEQ